MNEQEFAVFLQIHRGLPRQGPGSPETTARAYERVRRLMPERPRVLDVGCGSGAQTLELASLSQGSIVALDFWPPFLEELRERIAAAKRSEQVTVLQGDMNALDFEPGSFDLIWSEGAIYIAGFGHALRTWRPLLREGGCFVVTEACWLRPPAEAPAELRRFWDEQYPVMKDIDGNLQIVREAGYEVIDSFVLPESCWWNYYSPIESRLDAWLAAHPGDEVVRSAVEMERYEIAMYRRFSDYYGYVFYLMQKR